MPCDSSYMDPNTGELNASRVLCLLGELRGEEFTPRMWSGYHPDAYQQMDKINLDALTAELCEKLQNVTVTDYSLELQMWWRDHKKADAERLRREISAACIAADRKALIDRLTPYERELLGVAKS